MEILFYGSGSTLNTDLAARLVQEIASEVSLTWIMTDTGSDELPHYPGITICNVASGENLQEGIRTKLSGQSAFKGVVFAEGIGGVRPAKLNTESFVEEMFRLNTFSFFELIGVLLKERLLAEGASVVCLSSVSSIRGLKSKTVYSASKAALDAAVRGMAAELAPKKIRVNSIQKGWVRSDMNLDFIQSNRAINSEDDYEKQVLGAIEPTEIANLMVFLLSDKVRTMTGTAILLDGGYTL
jgi:NAD(P)-dependent dehydrogenase (short-subunit alcohol dehydrogenase family)